VKYRTLIGGIFAAVCLMTLPAWAVEYRLEVTNLDDLTFSSYLENGTPSSRENEPMKGLEVRLDQQQFPPAAVLPGREVQLLEDPAYGGTIPPRIPLLPVTGKQAWTTYVFDANPGDTLAFVVKADTVAWQEVWDVAANAGGTLRRLSVGNPAIFGHSRADVLEVSQDFIANAVDRGTFPEWVAQNATAVDGLSVVVGQGDNRVYDPDRVYLLIKLPPKPHTFKVVIGWRNHEDKGDHDDRILR
jgi:hypothetical protein